MKKILYIIGIVGLFVLFSCGNNTKMITTVGDTVQNDYSVRDTIKPPSIDTTAHFAFPAINEFLKIDSNLYSFSIDTAVSIEGSQGSAYYDKGEIKKIEFEIFGETRRNLLTYSFQKNKTILIREKDISYPEGFDSAGAPGGTHIDKDSSFFIDYNGYGINSKTRDSLCIGISLFPNIKKVVPFTLPK